jgi:DNA-binding response OmpR family regulator
MGPPDILIVEDDPLVAGSYELALSLAGYVCHRATTGSQALALLASVQPRVILLDVHLATGSDGIETAAQIRVLSPVPIVLTSGSEASDVQRRTRHLASIAYLPKPTSLRDLLRTVAQAVGTEAAPDDDSEPPFDE